MGTSRGKSYLPLLSVALLVAGLSTFLYFMSPSEIIDKVGVRNSYLVVFLMAAIGGLSSLTGVSFFAAVATFSTGGANPWLLGLAGGIGLFISDTAFFYLAKYGKRSVPERLEKRIERLARWIGKVPFWAVFLAVVAYIGFTPLPNDILMVALALAGIQYLKAAPAVLIGSISIATLTGLLARTGLSLF